MIYLLGGNGYVGSAFVKALAKRGLRVYHIERHDSIWLSPNKWENCEFLINAAGYTGKPNVDACEDHRAETMIGNVVLPLEIAKACELFNVPWGHVSSGCIYDHGPKWKWNGQAFGERNFPNFTFCQPRHSFYTGTKALAEQLIAGPQTYIWRLRIPFDQFDGPRNYLSKLQRYPKLYDARNSLSHLGDFVNACLDLWELKAPFGTYNVTNPGAVWTREVVEIIQTILKPNREFEFFKDAEEFYQVAKTPRSNCVLDVSKLLATGIKMQPVREAITSALENWVRESKSS